MKSIFPGILIILGCVLSQRVFSDDTLLKEEAVPDKIIIKRSENLQFNGLKLKGQLKKPDLSYIYKRKGLRAEEIVNIPENFNEDIAQGAGGF